MQVRTINDPQPGYWLIRVAKNGPLTPARIWYERDPEQGEPEPWANAENRILGIFAEIAGRPASPERVWHTRGRAIPSEEYDFLLKDLEWARTYKPRDPIVTPDKPVKLSEVPLPF